MRITSRGGWRAMWRKLLASEDGSIAVIFGLMAIVIVMLVGGAIDFGRAYTLKNRLQESLDAACLAAASHYVNDPTHDDQAALQAGTRFFQANTVGIGDASMTSSLDAASQTVQMSATVTTYMPFLSIVGLDSVQLQVASQSTATQGVVGGGSDNDVEIAMMLDTTGSMGDSDGTGTTKIQALKTAASNLIDILIPDTGTIHAKIALAPFAPTVKLSDAQIVAALGLPLTKTTCTKSTTTNQCTNTTCQKYNKDGSCKTWNQSCTQVTTCTQSTTTYLRRCVTERMGTEQYTDAAPAAGAYAGQYRPNGATDAYATTLNSAQTCTPNLAIVPLTSSKSTLKATINAFTANGSTAGSLGTAWAWYLLSPNWAQAIGNNVKPYGTTKLKKIAVLMTDGSYNTEAGVSYSDGGSDATRISNNAVKLCSGMKQDGIEVYTVGFKLDNQLAKNTLSACASDSNHYFLAENGDQLNAAFKEIAFRAVPIHLSQ
jgi:Flp pilus assembly protein TadG